MVSTDSIVLLELCVVANTEHHFLAARSSSHKEDCYSSSLLDFQQAGFLIDFVTIKVGCVCHVMQTIVTKLGCHLRRVRYVAYFSRQLVLPSPVHVRSYFSDLCIMECSWFAELLICCHVQLFSLICSYDVFFCLDRAPVIMIFLITW